MTREVSPLYDLRSLAEDTQLDRCDDAFGGSQHTFSIVEAASATTGDSDA